MTKFRVVKMRIIKWLYPGMKIKRWIILLALGILMVGAGINLCLSKAQPANHLLGVAILTGGVILIIIANKKMIKSVITIFLPQREKELVDIVYHRRQLSRGARIVAIGGGTGLSVLLRGIKEYTSNSTAIVAVSDSGGSSGKLRNQFNVLPPGDIRNCLVALADAEPLMRELFQFRFKEDSELAGHSFGNLFITALSEITGDFEEAVRQSSKVLAIRGHVVPSTLCHSTLVAEYMDGTTIEGQAAIPEYKKPINRVYLKPQECQVTEDALTAINEADVIILGPGSLYTSVIPNLLVKGVVEAISFSRATKMYICNVMTEPGETDGYTAYEHLKAIIDHTQADIIDYCIVNTASVPEHLLAKYKQENKYPVQPDTQRIRESGYQVIEGNMISTLNYVRHNSSQLAKIIMDFVQNK